MLMQLRQFLKNDRGTSTLEFLIALLPVYGILIWIAIEANFFYNFIVFDGFADARNEMLEECHGADGETIKTFRVKGGIPIISDLIDFMTIFFPDSDQLQFVISAAGD